LEIGVNVRFGDTITRDNVDNGAILAVFPDGAQCELDIDKLKRRKAEFDLKLRQRDGVLEVRDGDCSTSTGAPLTAMPSIVGEVQLQYDADANPATPNVLIASRAF